MTYYLIQTYDFYVIGTDISLGKYNQFTVKEAIEDFEDDNFLFSDCDVNHRYKENFLFLENRIFGHIIAEFPELNTAESYLRKNYPEIFI